MTEEERERTFPDPNKVEAGRKGGLRRQENWRRGVKECQWCGKLSADLNEHPCFIAAERSAEDAAATMRDACVEAVKTKCGHIPFEELIDLLESLTLDQEKQS